MSMPPSSSSSTSSAAAVPHPHPSNSSSSSSSQTVVMKPLEQKLWSIFQTVPFNVGAILAILFFIVPCAVMFIITLSLPVSSALCFRCGGAIFVIFVVLAVVIIMAFALAGFHIYNNLAAGREAAKMRERRSSSVSLDGRRSMDGERRQRISVVPAQSSNEVEMQEFGEVETGNGALDEGQKRTETIVEWAENVGDNGASGSNAGGNGQDKAVTANAAKTSWTKEDFKFVIFNSLRMFLFASGALSSMIIFVLGIIIVVLSYASLPSYSGTITLDSSISGKISKPIVVRREENGVVHIEAETDYEAFFGQGFIDAQDRLFQMDLNRRAGIGNVSAVLGEAALGLDLFARTLNLPKISEADFDALSDHAKDVLRAYVDGVNAYIQWPGRALPPEYTFFGFEPEPWTVGHALTWVKLMSWTLSANMRFELDRYELLQLGHSKERVTKLMPEYVAPETVLNAGEMPHLVGALNETERQDNESKFSITGDTAAYIPKKQRDPPGTSFVAGLRNMNAPSSSSSSPETTATLASFREKGRIDLFKDRLYRKFFNPDNYRASNNWVIGGGLTGDGKPIVCDDPHLAITAPNIWTLVHLKSKESGMNVIGASFPGIPSVVIGKNDHIAWGVTNGMSDVQDFYVMKDSDDKKSYMYNGTQKEYKIRKEIIQISGADDLEIEVRESVYGPVVNDLFDIEGESVSFRWVSLDEGDTTFEAILDLNTAKDWTEFRNAVTKFVAPTQSFVYGDKKGNIGYITPGKVPIRKLGHSGLFPVPGDGTWDWEAFIPFDDLPQVYNPSKGYIATANNRVQPYGYPYGFGRDFVSPHRQRRIVQVLEKLKSEGTITVDHNKALHFDTKSALFDEFKWIFPEIEPWLAEYKTEMIMMKEWDGVYRLKEVEPLIWEAFFAQLQNMSYPDTGHEKYIRYVSFISDALKNGDPVCSKHYYDTGAKVKDCVDYAALAFSRAIDMVRDMFMGQIPRWGDNGVGQVNMEHSIFGGTPLDCLFSRDTVSPAGTATVNVANIDPVEGFQSTNGPSYREVIHFDDNVDSFIIPLGNSGNTFSIHYDNMVDKWANGDYYSMRLEGYDVTYEQTIEKA